jgi:hypothetical protein
MIDIFGMKIKHLATLVQMNRLTGLMLLMVQKSEGRVARFFLAQYTNTGKIYQITTNLPNAHNIFEMAVIYSK